MPTSFHNDVARSESGKGVLALEPRSTVLRPPSSPPLTRSRGPDHLTL